MSLDQFILVSLAVLCISLILSNLLIRRRKIILALLIGLVMIGAFQAYLHLSFLASVNACIDRACTSAGLPLGCHEAEFGCTEWGGVFIFIYYITGIAQVIVFAIASGIMIFLASRKKSGANEKSEDDRKPPVSKE